MAEEGVGGVPCLNNELLEISLRGGARKLTICSLYNYFGMSLKGVVPGSLSLIALF
jgi:hypothetical protein